MIKPLKVTMVVYAVLVILFGLAYMLVPRQLSAMLGHEVGSSVDALFVYLGASFISPCVFLIIVARDPLKYILGDGCGYDSSYCLRSRFFCLLSLAHIKKRRTGIFLKPTGLTDKTCSRY